MEVSNFIIYYYLLFLFNSIIIIKIVPYGWKNPSHYEIEQIDGPDSTKYIDIEGTLIASPYLSHLICLSNGTYIVTLDDVPESDDFIKDDEYGYKSQVGVEEYRIFFNLNSKYKIKSSQWAVITVTGKTATISIESPNHGPSKYKLPTGGIIGLILVSIILLAAVIIVFFDTTTLINRFKSIFGLSKRNNNPNNENEGAPVLESY